MTHTTPSFHGCPYQLELYYEQNNQTTNIDRLEPGHGPEPELNLNLDLASEDEEPLDQVFKNEEPTKMKKTRTSK